MENKMRKLYGSIAVLTVAAAIALTGCKDDDNKDDSADKLKKKIEAAQGGSAAEEDNTPDKYYEIDQRGYIMSYSGPGGEVEIPSTINGEEVTGLGHRAFFENTDITSVIIPDTATVIDTAVFEGCSRLENVKFPAKLVSIGGDAFKNCPNLTDVKLPATCSEVGPSAFTGSGKGSFEGSAAYYGERCFDSSSFDSISFADGADVSAGWLFYESKVFSVKLPSDAAALGESAFAHCDSIEAIELPDSVKTLGEGVFSNIHILPKLKLNEGLEELPKDMTASTRTDVVIIPKSVKKIGAHAIYDANTAVIQNPEVEIEEGGISASYVYLEDAAKYVFPSSSDYVMSGSQLYLDGIYDPADIQGDMYSAAGFDAQIYLPMDATEEESDKLDQYLASHGDEEIAWISGVARDFICEDTMAFDIADETLIGGCSLEGDTLFIPRYVTTFDGDFWGSTKIYGIEDGAFENSGYKTVFFPGNMQDKMGSKILAGNTSLKDIWFNAGLYLNEDYDVFESDTFAGIPEDVTVHIPASFTSEQRQTAEDALHAAGIPETATFDYYSLR